jgi:hypothetical protein
MMRIVSFSVACLIVIVLLPFALSIGIVSHYSPVVKKNFFLFFRKKALDILPGLCYNTIRGTEEPTHRGEEGKVAHWLVLSNYEFWDLPIVKYLTMFAHFFLQRFKSLKSGSLAGVAKKEGF